MIKENVIGNILEKKFSIIILMVIELVFSALAIVWFLYPEFFIDKHLYGPFFIINKNFMALNIKIFFSINLLFFLYIIPLISIFKIASVFLMNKIPFFCSPNRLFSIILNIINSNLIILFYIRFLTFYATGMDFFYKQVPAVYYTFSAAVLLNIFFVYLLLKWFILSDRTYNEFIAFKKIDKLDKKQIRFFLSIQKKLIISMMIFILIIISILSIFILYDYKKTIVKSVEYIGKTIAEQSATYFKEYFNDAVTIDTYLRTERDRNIKYELKFESLTLYKKQGKEEIYIAENSTNDSDLYSGLTAELLEKYSQISASDKFFDKNDGIHRFISPIRIQNKLVGFSVVRYSNAEIYKTYFRAQIRIIILTVLFIYLSYILVYVLGNKIVFPLLYLRMNVKKISGNLSKMITGEEKISASLLAYDDDIKTNDEIKVLSYEIKNMTTVLKGIIPYVSFSTLKQTGRHSEDLKTVNKNLTFLFTDIRGFTSLCEGLPPNEIVEMINHYLEVQTEIIINNKGDIDKFVGDQIMAEFEGEGKELNACRASLELKNALKEDKIFREKRNLTTVDIGIGINTGTAIFGNIGAKERKDLTSIGDTVNLAARLEGANKEYNTKILITEFVYEKVRSRFICREIDLLTVKGKSEPVRIYEILESADHASRNTVQLKAYFEKALMLYRSQNWDEAYNYFKKIYDVLKDETSKMFIDRVKIFKKNPPPENWDGVFTLNIK